MELSAILAVVSYLAAGILSGVIAIMVADDISTRAVITGACFWGLLSVFGYLLERFDHRLGKRFWASFQVRTPPNQP